MSDVEQQVPGHGPPDPGGYCITEVAGGYRWTRRTDGRSGGPHPTRAAAVAAALEDREGRGP